MSTGTPLPAVDNLSMYFGDLNAFSGTKEQAQGSSVIQDLYLGGSSHAA